MLFRRKVSRRLAMKSAMVAAVCATVACNGGLLETPEGDELDPAASLVTSNTFMGDRVQTVKLAYIYSGPSTGWSLLGTQPVGALGTIVRGWR